MSSSLLGREAPASMWGVQRYKVIDASWLKIIAMISMVIDHIGAFIFGELDITILSIHGYSLSLAYVARCLGRIAFPIYAFLIAEGFRHTRSRKKYAMNMFVFAIISEIPYNLVFSGTFRYNVQNVYFTLLLGLLMIWAYDALKKKLALQIVSLVVLFVLSILVNSSHTYTGVVLILLMYVLHENKAPLIVIGTALQPRFTYCSIFGYIPLLLYNGKRGFIKGKFAKYFFYAFYPAHLLLLYFLKRKMFGY